MKGGKKSMKFTLFKGAFPDMVEEVVSEFEAFALYQALLHLEEEGYMVDPVHLIRSAVIDGYEYVDFGDWIYFLRFEQA